MGCLVGEGLKAAITAFSMINIINDSATLKQRQVTDHNRLLDLEPDNEWLEVLKLHAFRQRIFLCESGPLPLLQLAIVPPGHSSFSSPILLSSPIPLSGLLAPQSPTFVILSTKSKVKLPQQSPLVPLHHILHLHHPPHQPTKLCFPKVKVEATETKPTLPIRGRPSSWSSACTPGTPAQRTSWTACSSSVHNVPTQPLRKSFLQTRSIHSFLRQDFTFLQQELEEIKATTTLSLNKEPVRHVIPMSYRERDNVSQKLIWQQKKGSRVVTLATDLVFLGLLCIILGERPGQHEYEYWCDNLKYLFIGFILKCFPAQSFQEI